MKTYFDIEGDGGSGILQQVQEQDREIARNLAGVRHRLAVGSGKGGVGKSTLTMQLGLALGQEGLAVAILDADLNGPTQARLAGLRETPLLPGGRGLAMPRSGAGLGVVSLGSVVPENEAVEFSSVAEGSSHTWRATREFSLLAELLATVEWGDLDVLLIDLPPGAERTVQFAHLLGAETAFLLVTLPSDLARGVVARSVAALGTCDNPVLGYVENMKGYYCDRCQEIRPLYPEQGEVELDLPLLGSLPFDPQLAGRCEEGGSIFEQPERASSQALRELGRRVFDRLEALP